MRKLISSLLTDKNTKAPTLIEPNLETSILDLLSEGLVVCDAQSNSHSILYANPSFINYYNLNPNSLVDLQLTDLLKQYTSDKSQAELISKIENPDLEPIDLKITINKQDKWIRLNITQITQKEDNVNFLVLRQSDITQVHQAYQKPHNTSNQLTQPVSTQNRRFLQYNNQVGVLFEQSLDKMLLLDHDLTLLDINKTALTLFGHQKQQLIGTKITSLLYDFQSDVIEQTLKTEKVYKEIPLNLLINVKNQSGMQSLSGSVRYVTIHNQNIILLILKECQTQHVVHKELKKSQNQLENAIRKLNLATQAGGIGIWSWDFSTNELIWDERMYEMYGVDRTNSENNYTMWQQRVLDEDIYVAENALTEAREKLSQFNAEFRIQLPSGDIRWIKAAADVLFDERGTTPIGMGGVNIDITKEKNAQENFRHESEIALAASEAKSMFLANMSHEIRTPMNGVVGMLSLLSETNLNNEQKNMVTTIKDSALTLLHIINDILDFSKIEAGQMSVESVPVELQTLIERTLDVLSLQANNKGIELYLTYDARLPKVIMSDSVRLSQVLLNIIGNAVKFTDSTDKQKGKIWVSATLSTHDIAPYIEVIVEDNGIGMTEEQMKRLFNAFTQADTSTTRLYGGTGLGLSITHSLLDLMGGEIKVESHYGVGSRFYIELPFIASEEKPLDPTPQYINGARLLFVTNDDNIATFCDINLSQYQCKSRVVPTMQKALMVLEYAAKAKVDLDAIIIGPDLFHFFEEHPISKFTSPLLNKQKFVFLTRESGAEIGLTRGNCYVMPCSPFKPSEFLKAIGVIRGKISCTYKEAISPTSQKDQAKSKEHGLILVVDDQSTNRDVIGRQLDYLGYSSTTAIHGQEALQKWKDGNFDLILTDCHMPIMDGYELSKQVRSYERQDKTLGHTPIIAITANALVEASDQCIAAGMDDYLTKPVELKTLLATIKKWMLISPISATRADIDNELSTLSNQSKQPNFYTHDQDPISIEALNQILGTTDKGVLAPLLEGYWASLQEDIILIQNAHKNRQADTLQQVAHAAKGAAYSAGAEVLAQYFATLQNTAQEKNWPQLENTISESCEEIERLAEYLIRHSYIKSREVTL